MEDCLHTSSENLSKLVSWAHSHGTICTLIPNLKHLLTEGSHGNLTAMWGCSAGHAYHWPLTATCKMGPKERVCYQDSRSITSDSLSLQGGSGIQPSPGDRFLSRVSKGKGDCGQTRDSCDFSNCSEPSEVDDNTEDYNSNLFDIVCESSATDEDGDYEPQLQSVSHSSLRKRGNPGMAPGQPSRQRLEEMSGDGTVKKIKQEMPEDYYIVANAQLASGLDGAPVAQSPKQTSQRSSLSQTGLHKPSSADTADPMGASVSPSGNSTSSLAKPPRAPPPASQSRPQLPGHSDLPDPLRVEELKSCSVPMPITDTGTPPACAHPDLEIISVQALGTEPKAEASGTAFQPIPLYSCETEYQHKWPSYPTCTADSNRLIEEKRLEAFVASIDPVQLQILQTLITKINTFHERTRQHAASPPRIGQQELYPGSGIVLSSVKLSAIHQDSRKDCMRLFHLLFEHFFSEEDLIGAVAFGKHGKVPDGKKILDRKTVDGIISYVLRCSTLDGWTSVESSKLKKACINKCRLRMTPPALFEIERLKSLLLAERSRSDLMGETISGLKQDKELLQQELTKKAELICEFLQEQLTNRPEKRRSQTNSQQEPSGSRQHLPMYSDETPVFESPALFDSFDEMELHQNERHKMVKTPKRNREGENTRVRMKNVVGVIARYMTALQEFRRSVSMKVAFDRVGVDRNTISRTAAIAELSLAAPEVFHSLPPWDEKEETLAHYSCRCRQAMDDVIKAKIKAMKAKGELLPIVSK
ncbi:hypothetical protein SKAU_G00285880 [Synaphobranchus kaupii]|uniref:BEN domain-containing protein n=1 Tax=Synaphobranchus kaupii TaxID=118154 RepID=A0A9Q1EY29_SYNKA|nr:hypothetical protein SKAU_G00285880 [Synaphobranchus kaupii]